MKKITKAKMKSKIRTVGFGKKQIGTIMDEDFAELCKKKAKEKGVYLSDVVRDQLTLWLKGQSPIIKEI